MLGRYDLASLTPRTTVTTRLSGGTRPCTPVSSPGPRRLPCVTARALPFPLLSPTSTVIHSWRPIYTVHPSPLRSPSAPATTRLP